MARIIVGLSGGVDSAVAAYLLKAAGHEVLGLTLKTWTNGDGSPGRCCEVEEARGICDALGIAFYAENAMDSFRKYVIEPFVSDYLLGLTPNPCTMCNPQVKWGGMLHAAGVFHADYVATGHYARISELANGRLAVREAAEKNKDQSYMLYGLTQEQLKKSLFPLGGLSKPEVRSIAEKAGLSVALKKDSQEICFIDGDDYGEFVEEHAGDRDIKEGNFVDEDGTVLGKHRGIIHYTVGQRKGLGIALGHPTYVKEIRSDSADVVLSGDSSLYKKEIGISEINYMGAAPLEENEEINATVRIRYRHRGEEAVISKAKGDGLKIIFSEAVRAPAPGQAAVCSDKEGNVLLGGKIQVLSTLSE